MDVFIRRLLVTWQHPEHSLFDDGAILINTEGQRFCDEWVWPDREIAVAGQPGKIGYLLLDERLIERHSRWPHFVSTAPQIAYAYVANDLRLRPDVAVEARSLKELARSRNLPPERLEATVAVSAPPAAELWRKPLLGQTSRRRGQGPFLFFCCRCCFWETRCIRRSWSLRSRAARPSLRASS